jgi:hypothetical protein
MLPTAGVQDGTYVYKWFCGARQANLAVSGVTGGALRIEIWDDGGAVVHDNWYDNGLTGGLTAMTCPGGVGGDWQLRFTFSKVASVGAINIEADMVDSPDHIVIAGATSMESSLEFEAGWTSGPAQISLNSAITQGTVRIRMWDGKENLVLDCTNLGVLVGSTNGESNHGEAGTWKILIDFDEVSTAGAITIDHQ